jgi:hypothetical protein
VMLARSSALFWRSNAFIFRVEDESSMLLLNTSKILLDCTVFRNNDLRYNCKI